MIEGSLRVVRSGRWDGFIVWWLLLFPPLGAEAVEAFGEAAFFGECGGEGGELAVE